MWCYVCLFKTYIVINRNRFKSVLRRPVMLWSMGPQTVGQDRTTTNWQYRWYSVSRCSHYPWNPPYYIINKNQIKQGCCCVFCRFLGWFLFYQNEEYRKWCYALFHYHYFLPPLDIEVSSFQAKCLKLCLIRESGLQSGTQKQVLPSSPTQFILHIFTKGASENKAYPYLHNPFPVSALGAHKIRQVVTSNWLFIYIYTIVPTCHDKLYYNYYALIFKGAQNSVPCSSSSFYLS